MYISGMPHSLPLPPPGFDALAVEDQIDYVQSLWDRIAATAGQVPLQDWQQALLEERLGEHRRAPDEARPWEEVIARVQERLRSSR
jgi:putative addiction module component (TIGR02574 family)